MWLHPPFRTSFSRPFSLIRQMRKTCRVSLTIEHLEDRLALSSTSWTSIGPAPIVGNTSDGGTVTGRVTAIAADPNPSDTAGNTVYIGTGGGGVWRGENIHSSSPTWTALTDNLAAQTGDPLINLNVGALATAWNPATQSTIIYAGLGEANSESNLMTTSAAASQFYGTGIIKSTDGGQTWTLLGGQGSSNIFYRSAISKIVIDPTHPDNIYVAVSTAKNGVVGNEGIWHSSDGGQSWVNTTATQIPGSRMDMFSDLVMDPSDDRVLYAAVGEATGSAANGVYMTTDGGTTWTQMTNLPSGAGVGRISLALSGNLNPSGPAQYELYAAFIMDRLTQTATITDYSQNGNTVTVDFSGFAGLENFKVGETVNISSVESRLNGGHKITAVIYDTTPGTGSIEFTVDSSTSINETMASGTINSEIGGLYQLGYVTVGGSLPDDTTAVWNVVPGFDLPTPNGFEDSSKYNYVGNQGYYDTALAVNPYTLTPGTVQVYASGEDAFLQINNADGSAQNVTVNDLAAKDEGYGPSIHVDHHAILLDPTASGSGSLYTVVDGSDGGVWEFDPEALPAFSWADLNTNLPLGQFYGIAINPTNTSQMYGGVQDNGNIRTLDAGATPWQAASNDDGSLVYIDPTPRPYETVYLSVGGVLRKSNSNTDPFAPTQPYALNSDVYFSDTNQPGNDGANDAIIGDFPGVTYLMEPVTINGQHAHYLWYGGSDSKGNGSLWLSTDGGQTWSLIGSPTLGTSGNGWVPTEQALQNDFVIDSTPVDSIGVNPASPGTVYVGLRGGYLLTTTNGVTGDTPNGNASWNTSYPIAIITAHVAASSVGPLPQSTINVDSTVHFPDSGQLFVHTADGKVVVLTYTGKTATSFTGVAGGDGFTLTEGDTITFQDDLRFSDILVAPNNSQVAYVTVANFSDVTAPTTGVGGHVWMTTDGGSSWQDISGNLPDVPVWCIQQGIIEGQPALLVGTDLGVYAGSNVGGSWSWSRYGANLPNVQVRSMSLVPDSSDSSQSVLAAGTWGHGAYEIFIPEAPPPIPAPPPAPLPAPPAPVPAPGFPHSVFAQMALSDLNAGYSLASLNYQALGTLDSYLAYFFAAEAQYYANQAYNTPPASVWDWFLADFCAYSAFQYSNLSYSWSHSQTAAAAGVYEFYGVVNGFFALFNP